jgi:hypothetical protein
MKKGIVALRAEWLTRSKLDIRRFADATGNDYGTAHAWFRTGRVPRRKYLDGILATFPDWPVRA